MASKSKLTYAKTSVKIGPLIEEIRRVEKGVQRNASELEKATESEKSCLEALAECVSRIKEIKADSMVELAEYIDAKANFRIIEGYSDQATALRRVLQNEKDLLKASHDHLLLTYELLLAELMGKEDNVVSIFH